MDELTRKKLKNITVKEMLDCCERQSHCWYCPFYDLLCFGGNARARKVDLEQEIEL